ncbi:MAG: sulfite exporter TauE/SafE family protein [Pseudomonadota bacterium]
MTAVLALVPLFFLTALVYSAAGFGGGSTYVALLLLFSLPHTVAPKIALLCNLVVVSGGVIHYVKGGWLPFRRVLPFVVGSVPAAYFGGRYPIAKETFLILAAFSLAVAGLALFFSGRGMEERISKRFVREVPIGLVAGAILGFLGGVVGIGGGIFLAPLLYFLRWGNARQIAAASSFFILVNSLSGLAGQFQKSAYAYDLATIVPLAAAVFLGGQIGSRLSVGRLPLVAIQRTTACLILFVAGRLFWTLG